MTGDDLILIKEFKARIADLITKYEILESKNTQLKNEILEIQGKVELLEQEKSELGHKYENLRIAKYLDSGYDDNRMAKLKINKLCQFEFKPE